MMSLVPMAAPECREVSLPNPTAGTERQAKLPSTALVSLSPIATITSGPKEVMVATVEMLAMEPHSTAMAEQAKKGGELTFPFVGKH